MARENEHNLGDETVRDCRLFAKVLMETTAQASVPLHDISNPDVENMLLQVYNGMLTIIENGGLEYISAAKKMIMIYKFPEGFETELYSAIDQGRKNLTQRIIINLEVGDLEFTMCKDHGFFHGDGDLKERIDKALEEAIRYDLKLDKIKTAVQRGLQQNSARVYGLVPQFSEIGFLKQKIEYVQ